ncbi:hypothetical protein AMECASPLE_021437 [Ameca splendens]|uniref:Uncharacterized protein n=1 Tax=Ameca splendens TaxID=208324 RepID=A0ABV0XGK1_9TELE
MTSSMLLLFAKQQKPTVEKQVQTLYAGPAEVSCFRAHERERKSCEYFLFEPRGARLNRVDWFESCSSFMKHTHTLRHYPLQGHTHIHHSGYSFAQITQTPRSDVDLRLRETRRKEGRNKQNE